MRRVVDEDLAFDGGLAVVLQQAEAPADTGLDIGFSRVVSMRQIRSGWARM
jgi:hypothetical protein